jgi:hypothetical protein
VLDGLYVVGDSVWCPEVERAIAEHAPDVAVVNAGEATFLEGDAITMGIDDVREVARRVPRVVAVHMDGAERREAGVEPTYAFRTDDNLAALALVRRGIGVALVSRLTLDGMTDGLASSSLEAWSHRDALGSPGCGRGPSCRTGSSSWRSCATPARPSRTRRRTP